MQQLNKCRKKKEECSVAKSKPGQGPSSPQRNSSLTLGIFSALVFSIFLLQNQKIEYFSRYKLIEMFSCT